MYYNSLSIIITILLSLVTNNTNLFFMIMTVLLLTSTRLANLEWLNQSNLTNTKQLDLLYQIANLAINNNNLLNLFMVFTLFFLFRKKNNTDVNLSFVESFIFYISYNYNFYYFLCKNHYFPLHDNLISLIHPLLILISFAVACLKYLYIAKQKNKLLYRFNTNYYELYKLVSVALLLGMAWAASTQGWGGPWFWDPTEIILLLIWIIVVQTLHRKNFNWKITILFLVFYFFLNKLYLLNGIHNFYKTSLLEKEFYLIVPYIVILLLTFVVQTSIKKKPIDYSNDTKLLTSILVLLIISDSEYIYNINNYNYLYFIISATTILYNCHIKAKNIYLLVSTYTVGSSFIYVFVENNCIAMPYIVTMYYLLHQYNVKNKWVYYNHISPISFITTVILSYYLYDLYFDMMNESTLISYWDNIHSISYIVQLDTNYYVDTNRHKIMNNIHYTSEALYQDTTFQEKITYQEILLNNCNLIFISISLDKSYYLNSQINLYLNKLIIISFILMFYILYIKNVR